MPEQLELEPVQELARLPSASVAVLQPEQEQVPLAALSAVSRQEPEVPERLESVRQPEVPVQEPLPVQLAPVLQALKSLLL